MNTSTTAHTTSSDDVVTAQGTDKADPKEMHRVSKRASVHEKVVQAASRGEVGSKPTPRRRGPRRPSASPLHIDIKVDQRVLKAAKKIQAQGVYTTLVIVDHETVIVK